MRASLKPNTTDLGVTKDIDVHLMVQPVDAMITDFAKAGASYVSFDSYN